MGCLFFFFSMYGNKKSASKNSSSCNFICGASKMSSAGDYSYGLSIPAYSGSFIYLKQNKKKPC